MRSNPTVVWQWFSADPEADHLDSQGAGWYWEIVPTDPVWMPIYLSLRTEWEEAFAYGYQNVMRYWPGEVK